MFAIIEFVPMGDALTDPKKLDELERGLKTELENKKYEVVGESSFVVIAGQPEPTLFTYRLWAVSVGSQQSSFTNPIKMRQQLEEICEELGVAKKSNTSYLLPGDWRCEGPGKFVLYCFSAPDAADKALISVTESEINRYLQQRK